MLTWLPCLDISSLEYRKELTTSINSVKIFKQLIAGMQGASRVDFASIHGAVLIISLQFGPCAIAG